VELRDRHGLSQAELAHRAGTTQQAISRLERGGVSPTVAMLEHLAAVCGERLSVGTAPREVPFDPDQLAAQASLSMAERLELASSWNQLATAITGSAARALDRGLADSRPSGR
jgi:transcriptional regulator with XRE-family HTH domain